LKAQLNWFRLAVPDERKLAVHGGPLTTQTVFNYCGSSVFAIGRDSSCRHSAFSRRRGFPPSQVDSPSL